MNVNTAPPPCVLLGPQRRVPTVLDAIESLEIRGPIVAITAGWEERESEDRELGEHLGGRTTNLALFARTEDVLRHDVDLARALLTRRRNLRQQRDLYRQRLHHALSSARALLSSSVDPEILRIEQDDAIAAIRRLDAHHLERVVRIEDAFDAEWRPLEREHVARHRHELAEMIRDSAAVCVAGGHVGVLLHRMRMFDLGPLLAERPVVAWSAGAMALGERVVLFHDSPPQGPGDAEVLGAGLHRFEGVIPLPHAAQRLRLDDPVRVGLFARRFGPARCRTLDERSRSVFLDGSWNGFAETRELRPDGTVIDVAA